MKLTPIKYITDWSRIGGDDAMKRHCEHIISHAETYEKERVFEAKTIIDNLKKNRKMSNKNTKKISPILFSTPMVQAILEGKKLMTRRVIKNDANYIKWNPIVLNGYGGFCDEHGKFVKPKYNIGDILWVRETFQTWALGWIYRATYGRLLPEGIKWKPSIYMPKEACRIFLEVTNVRIERLQDITEEDAEKEGVNIVDYNCYENYLVESDWNYAGMNQKNYHMFQDPIGSFASLWESINKKGSWKENPFVFVYEFKVVEKPSDFKQNE